MVAPESLKTQHLILNSGVYSKTLLNDSHLNLILLVGSYKETSPKAVLSLEKPHASAPIPKGTVGHPLLFLTYSPLPGALYSYSATWSLNYSISVH